MNSDEKDAKDKILTTTMEMLHEVTDIDKITVRQIAERANVGVGLINYHFKSKDILLSTAIGEIMVKMANSFISSGQNMNPDPVQRLKTMLKELFNFASAYEKLLQFSLRQSLLNGDMKTPLFLIPVLKDIFGNQKDEIQLRIIALQIILPLQATSISPSALYLYSGIDLYNEAQRDTFIDALVNNILKA